MLVTWAWSRSHLGVNSFAGLSNNCAFSAGILGIPRFDIIHEICNVVFAWPRHLLPLILRVIMNLSPHSVTRILFEWFRVVRTRTRIRRSKEHRAIDDSLTYDCNYVSAKPKRYPMFFFLQLSRYIVSIGWRVTSQILESALLAVADTSHTFAQLAWDVVVGDSSE